MEIIKIFLKRNKIFTALIISNIISVFLLILLSNSGILPLKNFYDFLFFTLLFLLLAIYRPGWAFLFFIGTIALENINLAPREIGIGVRPFQFIGGLVIVAILIRMIFGRLNFKFPKIILLDGIILFFSLLGILSSFFALNKNSNFKLTLVMLSFFALYFLTRVFIQNINDLKKVIPFFLSSSVVVILYGIWQNILFIQGLESFSVMPGRPNATFTEPDWLGIFIVFLIATTYALIYYFQKNNHALSLNICDFKFLIFKKVSISIFQIYKIFLYLFLILLYVVLILTVSRSAWLGVIAISVLYLFFYAKHCIINEKNWKEFLKQSISLMFVGITSIFIVYFFNLTNFQLFNRFQSTGTGLQKITVSCENILQNKCLPLPVNGSLFINDMKELEKYCCRHINLEDIKKETQLGNFITSVYRKDPNVDIRGQIYQKSWQTIKNYPIFGVGWGNISDILGKDERGSGFNSSNIFLEVWLGAGLLGLFTFVIILIYVFKKAIIDYLNKNFAHHVFGLFLILGLTAILIPNLFNAGIMLGFLWIFLAISTIEMN